MNDPDYNQIALSEIDAAAMDVYKKEADWKQIDFAASAIRNHIKLKGDVVVTTDENGLIVSVTRQDADGKILKVLAESTVPMISTEHGRMVYDSVGLTTKQRHCSRCRIIEPYTNHYPCNAHIVYGKSNG